MLIIDSLSFDLWFWYADVGTIKVRKLLGGHSCFEQLKNLAPTALGVF